MSMMIIFFNAHAQVYVQRASLIFMPVMQALVKKELVGPFWDLEWR
jgi:hypothetical protein